ncbi:MAG: LysR family transcriptional regulator [Bermanella sp.]
MDQLHLMKVYVAVAEEQGFAAAARRLAMSPPAVTRAVAALEESLGVKLLNRTTRFVRATESGARYLEDARRILGQVQLANEAAAGINADPAGNLVVTAPVMFGQMFVMPGIVDYLQRYPKTQVDAVFLDRVVNMLEEGIDVGIRIGDLPDSTMRAIKVGSVRRILVASPDYLKRHGIVQSPDALNEHSLISSSAGRLVQEWRFDNLANTGKKVGLTIRIQPRLTVTTNDAAIKAACAGFGIARLLSYQVSEQLAKGELKILLENFEPTAMPVQIVHREGRLASAKVRAFIDLMSERLRVNKSLN